MTERFRVTWTEPENAAKPVLVSPPKPHLDIAKWPSPSGWHRSRLSWPDDLWSGYVQLYLTVDEETGEYYRFQIEGYDNRWHAHVVHNLDRDWTVSHYVDGGYFFTRSQAKIWCESVLLDDDCPPMYGEV